MAETPVEIARTCVARAESESPGNEWWSVSIARKHLEALLAELEPSAAETLRGPYVKGERRRLVADLREKAAGVLAATDYAEAYVAFHDLAVAVTALDEQIAATAGRRPSDG